MNILLNKRIKENYENHSLPPLSRLIKSMGKVSFPAAIETFLITLIGLLDTIMVSGVGTNALAGVTISQQPVFMALVVAMGLNAGITAIVARRFGEKDQDGAKRIVRHAILMSIIASVIMMILFMLIAEPFLIITGAKQETLPISVRYLRIVLLSLPFNYVRLTICAAFRASGNTKVSLITNVSANLVNLFLNYCLIMGNLGFPRLEADGAAIATSIGHFVAFIITICILRFKKSFIQTKLSDDWRMDKETTKNIINVGSNASIEQLFMRLGFYILAVMINNLGTEAVAVNAIVQGTISLAFSVTDGFAIGASALVGKSLGEEDVPKAFAYGRLSQITSFLLGGIMITLIIIFRHEVVSMFASEEDKTSIVVMEKAANVLIFAVFAIVPQSLQWVTTNCLRGAGDVKFTAKTAVLSVAIIRPLFTFICCYIFTFGVLGAWIGTFIDQAIRLTINNNRFIKLKWAKIKV